MKRPSLVLFFASALVFSQQVISEEIKLYNGEIALLGTLSYPKTDDKLPLAIFVHGSGNPDRNGNQGAMVQANYIKVLADSLNAKGVAFYRFDKRNSNPSNLARLKGMKFEELVEDLKLAIDKFQNDQRFNSIHLLGHSQGSLIGMLAASNDIASFTSIAGPGSSIDKTLILQVSKQSEELGKVTQSHIEELIETDTIVQVNPFLISIFNPQIQKYLKEWIALDPSEEIKKLSMPILIVNGDADIQVMVEDAENLKKANHEAQLHIIPKMNHVLKMVNSLDENQRSYTDSDFPLSKELVDILSEFIHSHE